MKKLQLVLKDFYFISQKTIVKKKKRRIAYSAIAGNLVVIFDILIILMFTKFLTDDLEYSNFLLDILFNFKYSFPFIVIIRFLVNYFSKFNILSLQYDVEADIRRYLIKEIFEKGNYSLADATYFINTLSVHISTFYSAATMFLTNIIQVFIFLIFLIDANTQLMLVMVFGVLLLLYPTKFLLKIGRKLMDKSYHLNVQTGRDIQRIIDNTYLIKILQTYENEFKNFKSIIFKNYDVAKKAFKYREISTTLPQFASIFSFSLIILSSELRKTLTIEFIGIILRFVQTLGTINSALTMLINSHVHVQKFLVLDNNFVKNREWVIKAEKNSQFAIQLNNVDFKYFGSEEFIFSNLSLNIQKGQHYIITGQNGSGKSTLIGLLSGILIPESGTLIKSDEITGYIGATPLIVRGTLRENLIYGSNKEIDDETLIKLLYDLDVFKEKNILNLNSQITPTTLSSGQMQKISFIRFLISEAKILFLDESTSNLDKDSKILINQLLSTKDLTIINSTHNKSDFKYDKFIKIEVINNKRELIV